jgi:hypothetical protein
MGFLDELNSTPIKTMPDGRRMFFPYGNWGRGYVIPTQEDEVRLRRLIGIYTIVALAVALGAAAVSEFWLLAAAAGMVGFYLLWVRIVLDGMPRTEETISYKEVMKPHVRRHATVSQMVALVVCLCLVGLSVAIVVYDRSLAMGVLPTILLFGAGAAVYACLLARARKRAQG